MSSRGNASCGFYLWPQMWPQQPPLMPLSCEQVQVTAHTIPEDCAAWQRQGTQGQIPKENAWPPSGCSNIQGQPPQVHSNCNCWIPPCGQTEQVKLNQSEVAQSCPFCDPIDCSVPGSSVHGIFQAIVLEWIAISFSRGSSQARDRTQVSRIVDRRFTVWATREVRLSKWALINHCFCPSSVWAGNWREAYKQRWGQN